MKQAVTIFAAASIVLVLSACGSSDNKSASATTPAAPVSRPADRKVAHQIPLGASTEQVEAKLGPPKDIEVSRQPARKKHHGKVYMVAVADYYYVLKDGKAGDTVDMSFVKGKLSSVLIRSHP